MTGKEFLRSRLSGARFMDGEIPLDVLSDLVALREMVLEVAKWKFKRIQDRQRSPSGFTDTFDLKLAGIEKGSATAVISLVPNRIQPTIDGSLGPFQKYYEQARDHIVSTINDADSDPSTNEPLPDKYLSYFDKIGSSLHDEDCLEISTPEHQTARLTRKVCSYLSQRSHGTKRTQEVTLHGMVPEADQKKMTFQLHQTHYSKIVCPMQEQHRDTIIRAFEGYESNTRVLVQGVGLYDQQSSLTGLESVAHISLLDHLDVPTRLDEFRDMADGWLEGHGSAPSHAGLDWLATTFKRFYPGDAPLPHTYPTPEGGIQMEWSHGDNAIVLEIDLHHRRGNWLFFGRHTDTENEKTLNLDVRTQWQWLANEIRNKIGNK